MAYGANNGLIPVVLSVGVVRLRNASVFQVRPNGPPRDISAREARCFQPCPTNMNSDAHSRVIADHRGTPRFRRRQPGGSSCYPPSRRWSKETNSGRRFDATLDANQMASDGTRWANVSCSTDRERSHRGLVQRFAKPPGGVTCLEGSNPSLSATIARP